MSDFYAMCKYHILSYIPKDKLTLMEKKKCTPIKYFFTCAIHVPALEKIKNV
jgi:hypothetical protein